MPVIRMVRIVQQIVSVRGEERLVDVKPIRFFPITDAGGEVTGFGRIRSPLWQVIIQRANWGDRVVKIRYNDKTGKFSIIFGEREDPIDPTSRHWSPDKTTRKIVDRMDGLNTDRVERELAKMCKVVDTDLPPDQQPVDQEFIDTVLGLLISSAEESRKVA